MRTFVRKHKKKIIAGHGIIIVAVLMSSSFLFSTSTSTIIFFTPQSGEKIAPGDTVTVDVNVNTNVPIDATGALIRYPEESFSVVGISKENSFLDLWTEETTIKEGLGEIVFSGGTTARDGHMGTGTIMTLTLKAKKDGDAVLSFDNVRIFPHDGSGKPLQHEARSLTYSIASKLASAKPQNGTPSNEPLAKRPAADLNGDGSITLSDLSILMVGMLSPYNPRYDLNADGSINLSDLSILLSKF